MTGKGKNPMLITALRRTASDRFTVVLADGGEIESSLGVVTDLRLFTGKDLEEEELAALRRDSSRSLARDKALEMISRRLMSRKELREKLLQKGADVDAADYSADWLQEHGFLNDESYAAAVARHYAAKGYGAGRVRSELGRRGVDRALWDEAVEQMPAADEKLHKFIAARLKDPNDREQLRRIGAALFRRGYSWEEIRTALRRYSDEIIEED